MEPAAPRHNLRPFIILGAVLALIAVVFGVYGWQSHFYATSDDAAIDGHVYLIAPQVAGRVAQVLVDDNQHVSAGQLLVRLDDAAEQVALLQAQAGVAQAMAGLAQAKAQADEMQASVTQAQQNYNRFMAVNPRATSAQQVDAATEAITTAKARLEAAQAAIGAAAANLQAAQAVVANAQLELTYTRITAPAPGHVAMKTVQPGSVVAPGSALMAVTGDDVWVTANYKETQLASIHVGAAARISIDAVPGIVFNARVDSIQYGTGAVFSLLPAQNATGNYVKVVQRVPVKLVFTDARVQNYMLAPGMSVEPAIRVAP